MPLGVSVLGAEAQVAPAAERVGECQLLLAVGHRAARLRRRLPASARPDGVGHERRTLGGTLAPAARCPAGVAARRLLTLSGAGDPRAGVPKRQQVAAPA